MARVLVVATSRKTRGGITSVIKAHETGEQWKKFHCRWVETHRDGPAWRKVWYLLTALCLYCIYLPTSSLVHIHVATTQSARRKYVFIILAKLFKKKIILHFHPSNEKFLFEPGVSKLYRNIFSKADRVLVLSTQWKVWIHDSLGDGPWMNKIEVLYNPCPQVNRTNVPKKNQILYAGTLLRRKGYDVLIKAFGRIAHKYPDWKLAFAGNPYLKEGINELTDGQKLVLELGILEQVKWLGWISGEEKETVFNESSIYCLASDGEGFPMGVLDAWAYGIPCVVTPVGGIPDIVHDGDEGLIVPVGDVTALAEALEKLITNDELRWSIVRSTDRYVFDTLNINVINKRLGDIYQEVLCSY